MLSTCNYGRAVSPIIYRVSDLYYRYIILLFNAQREPYFYCIRVYAKNDNIYYLDSIDYLSSLSDGKFLTFLEIRTRPGQTYNNNIIQLISMYRGSLLYY